MFNFFGFEFASPDRMTLVGVERCTLVRAGAAVPSATTVPPGNARGASAGPSMPQKAGTLPQVAAVAPSPPPSTLARPSPEVCRNTLLDKLGKVDVKQVRQGIAGRFKETIDMKVPNTQNLRILARGSGCDDPRMVATAYDFDANAMLFSITFVWDRPAGPAPAPIFNERVNTQSAMVARKLTPQAPGRLQAESPSWRVIVQDMPQQNVVLEAYAAPK